MNGNILLAVPVFWPMLAAVVAVSGVLDAERFKADMEESYRHKFANKPQVVEGNLKCLAEAMQEVKKHE